MMPICDTTPQGWRYVPGAQVFAKCTAGNGTNSLVGFKSKIRHKKLGVKPGKTVLYKAMVKNVDKSALVQGLALTVQLPVAGVAFIKCKASHGYQVKSAVEAGKKKVWHDKARSPMVAINFTATPRTITWNNLVLPPRKGMKFAVKVRVNSTGVYRGMPLVFSGGVYQQLPVNGLPYCSSARANQTALVAK